MNKYTKPVSIEFILYPVASFTTPGDLCKKILIRDALGNYS